MTAFRDGVADESPPAQEPSAANRRSAPRHHTTVWSGGEQTPRFHPLPPSTYSMIRNGPSVARP